MKILGIESSGPTGGVALIDKDQVLGEEIFENGMVHGREIAPGVERLCREMKVPLRELELIAVDVGPGSYTGLRVGLASAKALAFALGCPILGVSSLDAIAEEAAPHVPPEALLAAVIDARWDQIYTAIYRINITPERVSDLISETPDNFLDRISKKTVACGDAIATYGDRFEAAGIQATDPKFWHPRPSTIARIAGRRFAQGKRDSFETLVPLYLRKTSAETTLSQ